MDIKLEVAAKMTVETIAYLHDSELKTKPCDLYEWFGEETCQKIDFNSEINAVKLPEGKYKITIVIEKI